jgi:hypothetical protein
MCGGLLGHVCMSAVGKSLGEPGLGTAMPAAALKMQSMVCLHTPCIAVIDCCAGSTLCFFVIPYFVPGLR